jgi:hypothetical protein
MNVLFLNLFLPLLDRSSSFIALLAHAILLSWPISSQVFVSLPSSLNVEHPLVHPALPGGRRQPLRAGEPLAAGRLCRVAPASSRRGRRRLPRICRPCTPSRSPPGPRPPPPSRRTRLRGGGYVGGGSRKRRPGGRDGGAPCGASRPPGCAIRDPRAGWVGRGRAEVIGITTNSVAALVGEPCPGLSRPTAAATGWSEDCWTGPRISITAWQSNAEAHL